MVTKHVKPKALVLAFKNAYLNNTDDVFYKSIEQAFDVTYYGPGYVPLEGLILEAEKIYETLGPFDACFIHQYVTHNLYAFPGAVSNSSSIQHFYFDTEKFHAQCSKFAQNYNNLPCPKFLISMRTDVYAFTQREEEEYTAFNGYLLMPPPDCIAPVEAQAEAGEVFLKNASDRYIEFAKKNRHKIIPVAHLLDSDDFIKNALFKFYKVSIPGVNYAGRLEMFDMLKRSGFTPKNQLFLDKLFSHIGAKLNISLPSKILKIKYKQWLFKYLISRSLLTYTNGSAARIPVRKFFEIPAYHSLLVATPFLHAEHLGFVDGENYVVSDTNTILDVINKAVREPEWVDNIVSNSRALILDKHSDLAWGQYLKKIHAMIVNNQFEYANWVNGALELYAKPAA